MGFYGRLGDLGLKVESKGYGIPYETLSDQITLANGAPGSTTGDPDVEQKLVIRVMGTNDWDLTGDITISGEDELSATVVDTVAVNGPGYYLTTEKFKTIDTTGITTANFSGDIIVFARTATPAIFLPIDSESIASSQSVLQDLSIRAARDVTRIYPGPVDIAGGFTINAYPAYIGYLLALLCGNCNTDSTGTPDYFIHDFIPTNAPANELPSFTLEKALGDTFVAQYSGCKLSQLTLTAAMSDIVKLALEIIGRDEYEVTKHTPSYEDEAAFIFSDVEIYTEGIARGVNTDVNYDVSNIEVVHNNTIEPVRGFNLSRYIRKALPAERAVTFSFSQIFQEKAMIAYRAYWGDKVATTDTFQRTMTSGEMLIRFVSATELVPGRPYFLEVYFPKVYYEEVTTPTISPELVVVDVNGFAVWDSSINAAVRYKLQNDISSYAAYVG